MTLDELQELMREHSLRIECLHDFTVDAWPSGVTVRAPTPKGAIDAFLDTEREDDEGAQ